MEGISGYHPDAADVLFGSFIKYERLYEMSKHSICNVNNCNEINVYIDVYSLMKSLYSRGSNLLIKDKYVIVSCLINLAIHIRAYFETRHQLASKIFIVYGGARPKEAFVNCYYYNRKNIIMEDSNFILQDTIKDNLEILKVLCPYLHDIFYVIDYSNEFSVLVSHLIDLDQFHNPNIIYSKDLLSYQLIAFKPMTFLFRPRKHLDKDYSFVVTKSSLFNAYRYGELKLQQREDTTLDHRIFSIFQAISGVKTRNLPSLKNVNATISLLEKATENNIFSLGFAQSMDLGIAAAFNGILKSGTIDELELLGRYYAIDLLYQTQLYQMSIESRKITEGIINLYNPQELRDINDKYFQQYPLDLNRV